MATYRSASVLVSSDGTRTPGTAALFAEPARKGGTPPWAGDFRPANREVPASRIGCCRTGGVTWGASRRGLAHRQRAHARLQGVLGCCGAWRSGLVSAEGTVRT